MGKSMDWFLYDRVLRRKELKSNVWIKQTSMPITKFYSFCFQLNQVQCKDATWTAVFGTQSNKIENRYFCKNSKLGVWLGFEWVSDVCYPKYDWVLNEFPTHVIHKNAISISLNTVKAILHTQTLHTYFQRV